MGFPVRGEGEINPWPQPFASGATMQSFTVLYIGGFGAAVAEDIESCCPAMVARRDTEISAALTRHYEDCSGAEPTGYLPAIVTAAAALAILLLRDVLSDPAATAGRHRELDITTGQARAGRVTAAHGCGRCRSATAAGMRSWRPLLDDLQGVLA